MFVIKIELSKVTSDKAPVRRAYIPDVQSKVADVPPHLAAAEMKRSSVSSLSAEGNKSNNLVDDRLLLTNEWISQRNVHSCLTTLNPNTRHSRAPSSRRRRRRLQVLASQQPACNE